MAQLKSALITGDARILGDLQLTKEGMLNFMYPIGSIYMSTQSTSPSSLFGGSWTPMRDVFLYGQGTYAVGATGGAATVKLEEVHMPSHSHTWTQASCNEAGAHTHRIGGDNDTQYYSSGGCWSLHNKESGAQGWVSYTNEKGAHTHTITGTNSSTGGSTAHNNMPPYEVVYIWKRTA